MNTNTSNCRRCRCAVPAGHGYCDPCACWQDGYDTAFYCDAFEGTTPASAAKYAEQLDVPSDIPAGSKSAIEWQAGLVAGLTEYAGNNAETAARLEAES